MSNFDWYSEEEVGWDEPVESEPKRPKRPRPRLPWPRWLTVLLLLLALAGGATTLIYRQLNQRVDEVSYELEAEVRASHAVVYKAGETADRDLLVNFLSGRDNHWAAAQERVTRAGLLYARPGFGLAWVPGEAETAVADVFLSPDLTTAVLTATHDYVVDIGQTLTHTVTLDQVAVYRRGPDRWLLSPPDPEFWGEQETVSGERLTLRYPARDAHIAARLAADLEAELTKMCYRLPELNCPHDLHVLIELTANPAALFEANQPVDLTLPVPRMRTLGWFSFPTRLTEESEVQVLPTPSLLGLPRDGAGYQAIYRGYAVRMVSAVIADLAGWRCCDRIMLFQALLDSQLARLQLKRKTIFPGDLTALQEALLPEVVARWHTDATRPLPEATELYALVQFLIEDAGISAFALQQGITALPPEGWLAAVTAGSFETPAELERAWQRYLLRRGAAARVPAAAWPADALHLVCQPDDGSGSVLQRYDPASGAAELTWRLGQETAVLLPLPAHSALLVGERGAESQAEALTFLWQAGESRPLAQDADGMAPAPLGGSPDGRFAALSMPRGALLPYAMLDVQACLTGDGCDSRLLSGLPVWSPDGRHTILVGEASALNSNRALSLADAAGFGEQLVGMGHLPFWVDADTFGYVANGWRILFLEAETLQDGRPLFTFDFTTPLPEAEAQRANGYPIDFAFADRQNPNLIYAVLMASFADQGNSYLLAHDRETGESVLHVSWRTNNAQPRQYDVSPDGRWFVMWTYDALADGWRLFVHDLWQAETSIYALSQPPPADRPFASWSSDGAWLALADGGIARLLAPAEGLQQRVILERMGCEQAVWLP
ncbi:MAG: hypothetical protein KC425_19665 [Anaerolineales bacterium]|nr:hypothetical protein [Anaerolineales bacterium]